MYKVTPVCATTYPFVFQPFMVTVLLRLYNENNIQDLPKPSLFFQVLGGLAYYSKTQIVIGH